ncbi:restriction endonuclease, partial [Lactobacillus sp. XV13L]|nr:restriction endonuclease [Lactobacillus sp. XV13L]
DDTAGKFSLEDELMIWQRVLRENIFVIAKTPMAAAIARRTLVGYHDMDVNIEFVDNIVEDSKKDVDQEAQKIEGLFNNMKFDVVIGNPPYQEKTKGTRSSDKSIYHQFMLLSYKLSDLTILITPARFLFNAGDTPVSFNKDILSDNHFKVVYYEHNSSKSFPRTDIKGGI